MQDTVGIIKILKDFKVRLQNLYRDKFSGLILYGSFARGEYNENSDIDLAIILKGDISPFKEIDKITAIAGEFDLKYKILLSLYPISEKSYQSSKTPLILNIHEEGILI